VGWVILYRDPETGGLSNHWITLHEEGHPVGFRPLLVMDAWEHAYAGMERARYVVAWDGDRVAFGTGPAWRGV
jgi:Fe-Mn family superoxide dismutase